MSCPSVQNAELKSRRLLKRGLYREKLQNLAARLQLFLGCLSVQNVATDFVLV